MSYDMTARKKAKPAETQTLLPDNLRTENVKIEGNLTKFQNNLRNLIQLKEEIGTDRDKGDFRSRINEKQKEMSTQSQDLQKAIDDYGNISVPFRSQQTQKEKQEAYNKRLAEVVNKYQKEAQEIHVKMQQHFDLAKRLGNTNYDDENYNQDENSQFMQVQEHELDLEELKVRGETAHYEDIIKQRQEDLDNVEQLMAHINVITKDVNKKVHDQRTDLIEIDTNVGTALENAKEAEKNIEEAQVHQKSGGKCMFWVVGILGAGALIIILIVVLTLVNKNK